MDIHARIQAFLQQKSVTTLPDNASIPENHTKAGLVPFLRQDQYRFYLMKPAPRHRDLSPPDFQLCKGTRMILKDGAWQDIRDTSLTGEKEILAATALREGIEELGLVLENIKQLFDIGSYDFASAVTGKPKQMWLFAAEMHSPDHFLEQVEAAVAERCWMDASTFTVAGRKDHRYILPDIEARLKGYYEGA